ncbi:hypothetical protein ACIQF6_04530 [Kitasatospora sp. NPDC092948]|uniref:hypothetical protein n=1 Tax=Kitasatospora sp. NPDC092948 TaxID=3364088 RepID=UPI00381D651E
MGADPEVRFGRAEAIAMLARYGDRSPEQVDEHLGSLELTWLIAEAEQTYGVQLDLDDQRLDAIRTVNDAVAALGAQLAEQLGTELSTELSTGLNTGRGAGLSAGHGAGRDSGLDTGLDTAFETRPDTRPVAAP